MSERHKLESAISVIVPVQNSPDGLEQLLDALRRQTLPRDAFEVIVSDDGSDEPPFALATDDGHVKVVSGPRSSSYAARNRGVAASRGRQLAFCDGDCVPEPGWLERGVEALEDADIVAGRIQFILPDRVTVWTLIDMDTSKNQRATRRARRGRDGQPLCPTRAVPAARRLRPALPVPWRLRLRRAVREERSATCLLSRRRGLASDAG